MPLGDSDGRLCAGVPCASPHVRPYTLEDAIHAPGIGRLGPLGTPRTLLRDGMGEDLGKERAAQGIA